MRMSLLIIPDMKLLRDNLNIIVLLSIIMISCSDNSRNEYSKNIEKYLANEIQISKTMLVDTEVILVHVEACSYCIETITKRLNDSTYSHSKRIVVLIGKSNDIEISKRINEIDEKFQTYLDEERHIYRYETGFGKPFLLRFDNIGELVETIEIKDEDIYSILN